MADTAQKDEIAAVEGNDQGASNPSKVKTQITQQDVPGANKITLDDIAANNPSIIDTDGWRELQRS